MHEQKDLQSHTFFESSIEDQNVSENSINLFNYLVFSKELLVSWVKTVLPRPTQSTLLLSVTLYLLAICSTLKRQENGNWFSLLLEAKMPGLTKVCQESSWESFENITSEYINSGIDRNTIEGEISKSRTLIRLPSPWEKQVRKAFLGFFLEKPNVPNTSIDDTLNFSQNGVSSFKGKSDLLPWYRIDACTPLGDSIVSVRENSFQKKESNCNKIDNENKISYVVSPLLLNKTGGNKKGSISNKILALDYLLPFQANKKRVYAENDVIPSKVDSAYSNQIPNFSHLLNFEKNKLDNEFKNEKQQLFEHTFQNNRKKFLGREWVDFEDALKQLFYFYGLTPPSDFTTLEDSILSETESEKSIQNSFNDAHLKNGDTTQIISDRVENIPFLKKFGNKLNIENPNQLTDCQQLLDHEFFANDLIMNRFMSGYKFPEYTQIETASFYTQFLIPRLILPSWCSFSQTQLLNSVVRSPLKIKVPPALPVCFYKQKIFQVNPFVKKELNSLLNNRFLNSLNKNDKNIVSDIYSDPLNKYEENIVSDISKKEQKRWNQEVLPELKTPNFTIKYRAICLEELKEVTQLFHKLGRDYQNYLSQPKDSPGAIEISPSLEDDQLLQAQKESIENLEADSENKNEKSKPTQLELLQKIRELDHGLEEAKKLQSLAYNNKAALYPQNSNYDFPNPKNFDINSWITQKLGDQNMLSDRKYSFWGRMNILPKRLVAKEQEDISKQILGGIATRQDVSESHSQAEVKPKVKPLLDLQARARRDLIQFLAEPDLEARHNIGKNYRTHMTDPRLRGKPFYFPYGNFFWQKKKLRSTLLGSPSRRYVVMPTISQSDWQKILEWQLKNYFFEEDKRLEALRKEDSEKTFKIKRIHIYLPWVTLQTPLEKPFEWPLTRVDFSEGNISSSAHNFVSPSTLKFKEKSATESNQNSMLPTKMILPSREEPVDYWITGRQFTLSSKKDFPSHNTSNFSHFSKKESEKAKPRQNLSARKVVNKQFLFEPLTHHSWLIIYQLFLAFFLRGTLKYIYRVQLRNFIIAICSSPLGMGVTSSEFREWIQYGPPKLFYTPQKRLQDVAGSEDTIPIVSEVIWFLRNGGRGRNQIRGVLLAGASGTEKTSLLQAIAGEAQVPVIVQSMNALILSSDQPYEKLENAFTVARKKAPCVLFLDELDEIGKSRNSVVRNDIGASDSLLSLDLERGETKLQFANLSEKLQTSSFSPNTSYLNSRWQPTGSSFCTVGEKQIQNSYLSETNPKAGKKGQFGVNSTQSDSEGRRINLLLRLLTEMDGVLPLHGVVVIATTQRPTMLDPALLRPGRFDRIVNVQQPNKTRRIQLFKSETQKMGENLFLPWDYFGVRTAHLSGSQILSAINQSSIRAIINDTVHTIETLEHGINCVTGGDEKIRQTKGVKKNDPFYTSRLAFYQAGKAVVQSLLLDHPQVTFLSLTQPLSQSKTRRYESEAAKVEQTAVQGGLSYANREEKILEKGNTNNQVMKPRKQNFELREKFCDKELHFIEGQNKELRTQPWKKIHLIPTRQISSARTRLDFETRLVGLYAGKAGELLHISARNSSNRILSDTPNSRSINFLWESNLGFVELLAASSLIHLTIGRWYLYSQRILPFKSNRVIGSLNHEQLNEQNFVLFQNLSNHFESDSAKTGFWGTPTGDQQEKTNENFSLFHDETIVSSSFLGVTRSKQKREKAAHWQEKICQQIEMSERPYGRWYRLYLPKVEESERNEEWVAPDTVFHQSDTLPNLKVKKSDTKRQLKTLNDLYLIERDSLYHNMVINCFTKAFYLLGENRELLDFFADHLIRFKILRSYEITRICSFYFNSIRNTKKESDLDHFMPERNPKEIINPF